MDIIKSYKPDVYIYIFACIYVWIWYVFCNSSYEHENNIICKVVVASSHLASPRQPPKWASLRRGERHGSFLKNLVLGNFAAWARSSASSCWVLHGIIIWNVFYSQFKATQEQHQNGPTCSLWFLHVNHLRWLTFTNRRHCSVSRSGHCNVQREGHPRGWFIDCTHTCLIACGLVGQ